MDAVLEEIDSRKRFAAAYRVETVFFGGGTPSSVPPDQISLLLEKVKQVFLVEPDAEITMEANPGTFDDEKVKIWMEAGINRLSMGMQSADNGELKTLGRIHTFEEFEANYLSARKTGFRNINLDLMSALPGQTEEKLRHSLNKAVNLRPEHISVYDLIIEEGTPFYDRYGTGNGKKELPDEEESLRLYDMTERVLSQAGYEQYEISNYAKLGFACRHNQVYWTCGEYLGIGQGASSYINGVRYHNETEPAAYIKRSADCESSRLDVEFLTLEHQMEEFMFLGLRRIEGISSETFKQRFGIAVEAVYGSVLQKHENNGLLIRHGQWVRLTRRGIHVSNYVFADFLLERRNNFY